MKLREFDIESQYQLGQLKKRAETYCVSQPPAIDIESQYQLEFVLNYILSSAACQSFFKVFLGNYASDSAGVQGTTQSRMLMTDSEAQSAP